MTASGESSCELTFDRSYALPEPAEVALEDYARVLLRAGGAEALRASDDPGRVRGLRIDSPRGLLTDALRVDIEAFARELTRAAGGGGLGWS
jgi:hypothetical protein